MTYMQRNIIETWPDATPQVLTTDLTQQKASLSLGILTVRTFCFAETLQKVSCTHLISPHSADALLVWGMSLSMKW